jgi:hypothetical protein
MKPDKKPVTCPHCSREITLADLRALPAKELASIRGLVNLAHRKTVTHAGGRPPGLYPCPRCRTTVEGRAAALKHCKPEPE